MQRLRYFIIQKQLLYFGDGKGFNDQFFLFIQLLFLYFSAASCQVAKGLIICCGWIAIDGA